MSRLVDDPTADDVINQPAKVQFETLLDDHRRDLGVWADVTWSYDGSPRERFCYQLVTGAAGLQIAVLTPLDLG